MSSWPILSLVTFLPLVGALFCLVVNGPKEAVDRNCRSAALVHPALAIVRASIGVSKISGRNVPIP